MPSRAARDNPVRQTIGHIGPAAPPPSPLPPWPPVRCSPVRPSWPAAPGCAARGAQRRVTRPACAAGATGKALAQRARTARVPWRQPSACDRASSARPTASRLSVPEPPRSRRSTVSICTRSNRSNPIAVASSRASRADTAAASASRMVGRSASWRVRCSNAASGVPSATAAHADRQRQQRVGLALEQVIAQVEFARRPVQPGHVERAVPHDMAIHRLRPARTGGDVRGAGRRVATCEHECDRIERRDRAGQAAHAVAEHHHAAEQHRSGGQWRQFRTDEAQLSSDTTSRTHDLARLRVSLQPQQPEPALEGRRCAASAAGASARLPARRSKRSCRSRRLREQQVR